ncbi:MAG TPA: class IV adenylate cyclase [Candidatus Baltobacterales bacterium]|nr:class IV adenylate cyclase [Candidatus Baltobacterales bacterium]
MARPRTRRPLRDRSVESELKFRVSGPRDHARLRTMLRQRGAHLEGSYREENYRLNGPGKSTRQTTLRLRVLDGGPRGYLTAKGPARFEGRVKIREETEIAVSDAHATLDLLTQLGFQVAWSYPKRRAMWMLDGVAATLDVLEFGWFVELEGPAAVLPEMARSLGLDPELALRESYSVLARNFLKSKKMPGVPVTPLSAQPLGAPQS